MRPPRGRGSGYLASRARSSLRLSSSSAAPWVATRRSTQRLRRRRPRHLRPACLQTPRCRRRRRWEMPTEMPRCRRWRSVAAASAWVALTTPALPTRASTRLTLLERVCLQIPTGVRRSCCKSMWRSQTPARRACPSLRSHNNSSAQLETAAASNPAVAMELGSTERVTAAAMDLESLGSAAAAVARALETPARLLRQPRRAHPLSRSLLRL
mmetsp:Transcript_36793/g.85941  ORF Transcript_36793/g.85941 Transcript_36793/m.85941 type:complete len:212 (-) Transcript_36793:157-792(-)